MPWLSKEETMFFANGEAKRGSGAITRNTLSWNKQHALL